MKNFACLLTLLIFTVSFRLSLDAQNKPNRKLELPINQSKLTDEDYAKIAKRLFRFFEFDIIDLSTVYIHFSNVPAEIKEQLIIKIKKQDKRAKIQFLSKNQIENISRKIRYSTLNLKQRTKTSITISASHYSSCYSSGSRFVFRKYGKVITGKRIAEFVGECMTGNCVDGECRPMETPEDKEIPPQRKKPN